MGARDRWLTEGVAVLREEGPSGIRIDRLARRLGLTKGSFHHHFAGADDYRRALLAHCCVRVDAAIAHARARLAGLPPAEVAAELPGVAEALSDRALEVALRGWAVDEEAARAAVAAIDGARLAFLEEAWTRVLGDPAAARTAALVPHLLAVGASVSPGVDDADLHAVQSVLRGLATTLSR